MEVTDLIDFEVSAAIALNMAKYKHYCYERECDDYDSEMDFCLGLSGGAQGWD